MNAEGVEIMTALRMITTVAQRYLAKQEGTSQVVSKPRNNKKRKFEVNKRSSWSKKKGKTPQAPHDGQGTMTDLAATTPTISAPQKQYAGNLPKCNKCSYHHKGACRVLHCNKCNKKGHTASHCRASTPATIRTANTGMGSTCYECGEAGHFKRDCPRKKSKSDGGVEGVLTVGAQEVRNTVKIEESTQDPTDMTGALLDKILSTRVR